MLPHPSPLFSLRFRRCPLDGGGVQFSHKVQARRWEQRERHSTRRPARCRSPLGRPAVSLCVSLFPSSQAEVGATASRSPAQREGERERANDRAKKRTKPKCAALAERERRKVTAAAATVAESGNSKCGGGGAGLGRHLTNIIHVESKWKGQVCIGWQPCDSPTRCGERQKEETNEGQGERNFAHY